MVLVVVAEYVGRMMSGRYILPGLMCLLVAISAQAAAIAHAAPGLSGRMELCSGTGPVMVYVDAEGQPVGDPVYCPDFALALILSVAGEAVTVERPGGAGSRLEGPAIGAPVAQAWIGRARARGPPRRH